MSSLLISVRVRRSIFIQGTPLHSQNRGFTTLHISFLDTKKGHMYITDPLGVIR